ncbi:acetyl-CoA carboxylase biotin carboxylase subunit [bacterium]|nr:acetyl-CoA carboxylase biotin carboxylase subunit [candidate division CSSED10-310 bacterium]
MIKKVLIANRGEIALRVIRTCKELGIKSVAVFSQADADSLHVRFADEAVCIGPPDSARSYLNIPNIMTAAEITGVDAIHPGYGFLAENVYFAHICNDCGVKFIGPPGDVIRLMGDKSAARETARKAGVPIIPGTEERFSSNEELMDACESIGYPLIIKASAGGGGKGMRVVESPEFLFKAYQQAASEAQSAFGNDRVYIEKYLQQVRHVEFQILGDEHGNVIHLGERDCSIQRRHQKLIEEAPCPVLTPRLRQEMGRAAVKFARAVGYTNAGTIEFLLTPEGKFYFMEMNTRIQVEHPITEEITGVNLVKEQIRIASGLEMKHKKSFNTCFGHAIECRINAEDSVTFQPVPGLIRNCHFPGGLGVRVDTAIYPGYRVQPFYDSMLAKLIVHAEDRDEAIARMLRALGEFEIEGIPTTIDFHQRVFRDPVFTSGRYDVGFLVGWDHRQITSQTAHT